VRVTAARGGRIWAHLDGGKVFQRLGHLVALNMEMTGVDKVVAPSIRVEMRLTLGNLVIVVRELEVDTAGVKVEARPKDRAAHGRTLDVPPGSAKSPRGLPPWFTFFTHPLPQGKVFRVLLTWL